MKIGMFDSLAKTFQQKQHSNDVNSEYIFDNYFSCKTSENCTARVANEKLMKITH